MIQAISWVLRNLIIPACIIGWAAGVHELFKNKGIKDPMRIFTQEELATLELTPDAERIQYYADSISEARLKESKEDQYALIDHTYRDMKQVNMFLALYEDSLNNTLNGHYVLTKVYGFRSRMNCLRDGVMGLYGGRGSIPNHWQTSTLTVAEFDSALKAATYKYFPLQKEKDEEDARLAYDWKNNVMIPTATWFARLYVRGFPFALLLFILWGYRLRTKAEDETSNWNDTFDFNKNPLSFLFAVSIWPFILCYDAFNQFREAVVRAEVLRRRNSLFSLFSKQEEQLVALGRNMSLREFRAHLDGLGMTKKHSFIVALCVTLFMLFVPRTIVSDAATLAITTSICCSTDNDVGHTVFWEIPELILPREMPKLQIHIHALVFYHLLPITKTLTGFVGERDGVPKRYSFVGLYLKNI